MSPRPPTLADLRRIGRVTIMGLGRFGGGAGAAAFFAELGAAVTVTDRAPADKLAASVDRLAGTGVKFALGGHPEELFTDTDLVVANPAVRPDDPLLALAREHAVPVATEVGLALALVHSPWLAVTGSAGKSTTAALAAGMLAVADSRTLFGGNIGGDLITPAARHPAGAPLVIEMSSFQLLHLAPGLADGAVPPPRVAVITNVTPNHLDWHRDFAEYAEAKAGLLGWQTTEDWAVLNMEDPVASGFADAGRGQVLRCASTDPGGENAAYAQNSRIVLRLAGSVAAEFPLAAFRPPGRHNILNAVQAAAAAFLMCRDAAAVQKGLAAFAGLPHRLQTVGSVAGREFVNDSKATTPEAAALALSSIPGEKTLIAGGYDKLSPFEDFARAIQREAAGVVLLGPAGRRLRPLLAEAAGARPAGMPPLIVRECYDDFAAAIAAAAEMTCPGGTVLLSPGCASYGMFANYEERGERFAAIVRRMGENTREEQDDEEEGSRC